MCEVIAIVLFLLSVVVSLFDSAGSIAVSNWAILFAVLAAANKIGMKVKND